MASAFSSPRGANTSALTSSSAARASTVLLKASSSAFCSGVGRESCTGAKSCRPSSEASASARSSVAANLSFMGCTASSAAALAGLACAMEKTAASDRIQARGRSRARQFLTPHSDGFGAGARLRWELANAAQPLPGQRWIRFIQPVLLELQAILSDPVFTPEFLQAPVELLCDGVQIQHVVRRILQLRRRERPLRPVGASLSLRNRDIEQGLHQFRVADLGFHADARRRNLGVEYRRDHLLGRQVDGLEILARRMDELAHTGCGQNRHQRIEAVDSQCIDAPDLSGGAQLQQAQLGKKRALAQKFGVQADLWLRLQGARERFKLLASIDPNRVSHCLTTCTICSEL